MLDTDIVGYEDDEFFAGPYCTPCSEAEAHDEVYDLSYSIKHGLVLRITRDSARRRRLTCWLCSKKLEEV